VPQQAGYIADGNFITVLSGDSLTPAEWVAMVQQKTFNGAQQPLTISGVKGHGYASAGSLTVAGANRSGAGFGPLTLPAGVTLYSAVSSLVYDNIIVEGTIVLDEANTGTATPTLSSDGSIQTLTGTGKIVGISSGPII